MNVSDFKKLLQDNWKITKISTSFPGSNDSVIVEVDLIKGRETEHIKVDNSPEFYEYISHFKRFEDEFGNNEFIYVEDLEEYNKRHAELLQKRSIPQRPYKVFIGERELKGVHITNLVPPGRLDTSAGPASFGAAYFFVDLSQNPNYCDIDLRDQVNIIWADNNKYAFTGFTQNILYGEQSANFVCYGAPRRLMAVRFTTEISECPGKDILYFMASSVGLRVDVNQIKPNLNTRDFTVIFPVEGLIAPCDFKVGDVVFTSSIPAEISDHARSGSSFTKAPWSNVKAFAKVVLKANHFYQALTNGEEKVQRAVDWIQFRTDLTIPCIYGNNEEEKLYYSVEKNYSRLNLVRYGLTIDSTNGASIFHRLDEPAGHSLVIKYDPDEFLDPIRHILNKLDHLSAKKNKESQVLYQALHWTTLSCEKESPTDNLLQLWVAFDFICSGVKVKERLIQKADLKRITKYVEKCAKEDIFDNRQKEKLIDSINNVNDPPLMNKWDYLLIKLRLKLTESERELIKKLRDVRNDIIHGSKVTDLSIEEIEKFRSILERVFILKIKNL
jgi:hypothetical protein